MAGATKEGFALNTPRLVMLPPEEVRDEQVLELYNDESTMLPWLPFLCPMKPEAMKKRRNFHRLEYQEGRSMFLDLVDRETGELVGTSGFRTIEYKSGEAEWGVVIRKPHQRRGLCLEAYQASLEYLKKELRSQGILKLIASTLPSNEPMITFLLKMGLAKRGTHTFGGNEWQDYELQVQ
ncbi:hypothetical protein HOP50_16g78140 [Chloropicon primus]|uniref:N-acetyltransferase domain-containing protein n=1 Tax=Chloropicon primus TaxID=1764295 RepID=A0A5B8MXK3_9CHLO|nr:hypothetical protein A3770_16p77850 [Chloropicon primus]UPR04472.1 hypothetical protein HOP50_16g78140 [Chloropicon primus]|mmetsp:Transcript_8539/g.24418  ORF Transcript_8539/g.24418 Transcript_8539/m.24418 type:complete len:180 (-) Transcript_8539:69-608(-)|eukprot:QDZ25267.1 hypothetical protein A3770_16p77850 [Chloropicon primus]